MTIAENLRSTVMVAKRVKQELLGLLARPLLFMAEGNRFFGESQVITEKFRPLLQTLRCRTCQLRRLRRYRIDFNPYTYGEFRLPREPIYACHLCVDKYQSDPDVLGVRRVPG
jgi:hypothetical protein